MRKASRWAMLRGIFFFYLKDNMSRVLFFNINNQTNCGLALRKASRRVFFCNFVHI
jgi:hypothetical protein